ncbi:MAG: NAD(P)-dependent oxidoreductase [Chthoniobacterales bacterium]|nr:NAD(P)-dependent oxidoreductase [Chthoniobacterales bacterium]
MPLSSKLTDADLESNFADIAPPYTDQQAVVESARCLFCFDAPCISACPTGIDVPAFIKKITTGNTTGAARTILTANILGASCARVCPTEVLCEGACVLLDRDDDPIKIGRLQRYATDQANDKLLHLLKPATPKSGKRIAVIGGGPAGLGCAAELAQLGHDAVIFEKKINAGGLNTYGIAYYKMKPAVSLTEVELVKSLGVEIRCGVEVGRDLTRETLERDFDAIFLGIGLGEGQRLGIPGEELPEVVDALTFIEQIHTEPLHQIPLGTRVAVIGCGNTAIDAATQALRLGASEVVVVYRRSEGEMSAYAFEYDLAKRDGATFLFHHAPVEVIGDGGHVTGLRLARMHTRDKGSLSQIAGSEFIEPFDMIIKAVGQKKQSDWIARIFPELKLNRNSTPVRDARTGQTSLPHLFTGGDCANGGREVVNAVGEGKKAARGIHEFFGLTSKGSLVQPSRWGVTNGPYGSGLDAPIRVAELEEKYEELSPVSHPQPATSALTSKNQE